MSRGSFQGMEYSRPKRVKRLNTPTTPGEDEQGTDKIMKLISKFEHAQRSCRPVYEAEAHNRRLLVLEMVGVGHERMSTIDHVPSHLHIEDPFGKNVSDGELHPLCHYAGFLALTLEISQLTPHPGSSSNKSQTWAPLETLVLSLSQPSVTHHQWLGGLLGFLLESQTSSLDCAFASSPSGGMILTGKLYHGKYISDQAMFSTCCRSGPLIGMPHQESRIFLGSSQSDMSSSLALRFPHLNYYTTVKRIRVGYHKVTQKAVDWASLAAACGMRGTSKGQGDV
ncbi:hypothetical protein BGZ63DRAFT_462949 [Mariannaea sp. PMI_226]|nr:hypothetical protein BGZ63DRAFT_462949 [Mariannaea sp. PMI_226]